MAHATLMYLDLMSSMFCCIVVEISRKPSNNKVAQLFLDPTGRHIIVTTDSGDNYYLFQKWRRTKELAKLKVRGGDHIYALSCIIDFKHFTILRV